ncbi:DUF2726 domain-containing protein [uncultured Hydrogenophaga sp.]|uniref:DUF2726 domain-containing protein n=1 Tax=uncultured Hydrogenophaga sp. TaxID=199683 RepID=UPI00265F681F|nr:DUF2726 domain-containing protein [uncultured Hydrogenophaga sp.]
MNMMWTGIGITAVLLILCGWLYVRYFRRGDHGRDDRYSPERVLSVEQVAMLDYLQDTFPGHVVLPQVQLKHMLSVRRASNKERAQERLDSDSVDFVVCGVDGKANFAFDVEQYHLSNAEARAERVREKNRMLRTAGVRFVLLKNGIHRMPSPADFRAQLNLAELPKPKQQMRTETERDSVMRELESQLSGFDHQYGNTGFRESEIMGLSNLMGLDDDLAPRRSRQRAGQAPAAGQGTPR